MLLLGMPLAFGQNAEIPPICKKRAAELGSDPATIESAYLQTLGTLSTQVNDPRSDLVRYFKDCSESPLKCPGFFRAENPFHVKLFCDREIFNKAVYAQALQNNRILRECDVSKELFYTYPYEQDQKFQQACMTTQKESKVPVARQRQEQIEGLYHDANRTIQKFLAQSQLPEGFSYAIYKAAEAFGYGTVDAPRVEEGKMFAAFAAQLFHVLSYQFKDRRTQSSGARAAELYQKILTEFSQEKYGINFPLLSGKGQAYLDSIDRDRIDQLDYSEKPSSTYVARATIAQEFDPYFQQRLKEERAYYDLFHGFLPYHFIRSSIAKLLHTLQQKKKSQADWVLKNQDAFAAWADKDVVCLHHENTYCRSPKVVGLDPAEKKRREHLREIRITFLKKFWSELRVFPDTSGAFVLTFNPEESQLSERAHIYGGSMVTDLNQKMAAVNDLCWANVMPYYKYEEELASQKEAAFARVIGPLNEKMNAFLKIPRLNYLLKEEAFTSKIELPFDLGDELIRRCVTQGRVFGPTSLSYRLSPAEEKKREQNYKRNPLASKYGYPVNYATDTENDKYADPRVKFLPPAYQLTLADINEVEDDISTALDAEIWTLDKMFFTTSDTEIRKFMNASAGKRFVSILDYAVRNPSEAMGQTVADLLFTTDQHEHAIMQRIQAIYYVSIAVGVITLPFSAYSIPMFLASTSTFGLAIASHRMKIKKLESIQKDISMAAHTFNMPTNEAIELHGYYRNLLKDAKNLYYLELALYIPLNAVALVKGISTLARIWKEDQKLIALARTFKYEGALAKLSAQKKALLSLPSVKAALLDPQLGTDVFESIIAATKAPGTPQEIAELLKKKLTVEIPDHLVADVKPLPVTSLAPVSSLGRGVMKVQNFLLNLVSRYLGKEDMIRSLIRIRKLCASKSKGYFAETINRLMKDGKLAADEVERILEGSAFIVRGGRVVPAFVAQLDDVFLEFMTRNVAKNRAVQENISHMFYSGALGDAETWEKLLRRIMEKGIVFSTIEDTKGFLKYLKFLNLEQRSMVKYVFRGFRTEQLVARNAHLIDHVDEYLQLEKYARYATYTSVYENLLAFVSNPAVNREGLTFDDIARWMKSEAPTDFDLYQIRKAYEAGIYRSFLEPMKDTVDNLRKAKVTGKNRMFKEFLGYNEKSAAQFKKTFAKAFAKSGDYKKSYLRAIEFTERSQWLERDCFLRYADVRTKTAEVFSHFSRYAAWGSATVTYMANNHEKYDQQKVIDMEFLTRALYNILISQWASSAKVAPSARPGVGFVNKTWDIWKAGLPVAGLDFFAYPKINAAYWDTDDELQAELSAEMLQAPDVEKRLFEIFRKYPDLKQTIDQKTLAWKAMIEKYQGVENDPAHDEEMYREFVNFGLIEEFKQDPDYEQALLEGLKEVHYNELYENREADRLYQENVASRGASDPRVPDFTFRSNTSMGGDYNESLDRLLVLRTTDMLVDSPANVLRTHYVTKALCQLRHTKAMSTLKALGIYTGFKLVTDMARNMALAKMTQTTGK